MKKLFLFCLVVMGLSSASLASHPHKAVVEAKVYKKELSLSEPQTKKVVDLLSQEINDLRQLQSLRANNVEEYKTKTKETKLAFEMKFAEILNKEQLKYYQSHRSEIKEKIQEARLFW